jgi:hypothetical protein
MCLQAGADGIFLSVRDDWVEVGRRPPAPSLYEQLVRQTDLEILSAASVARFNIVHACGRPINFRAFAEYPAAILNWADRAAGPSIADVLDWVRPAICGGVDNLGTLVSGTPRDVAAGWPMRWLRRGIGRSWSPPAARLIQPACRRAIFMPWPTRCAHGGGHHKRPRHEGETQYQLAWPRASRCITAASPAIAKN